MFIPEGFHSDIHVRRDDARLRFGRVVAEGQALVLFDTTGRHILQELCRLPIDSS